MKSLFFIPVFLIFIATSTSATIEASISHACFKGDKDNYVEFNIYIVGQSVKWIQVDTTNSQASIEVNILFKQKGQIIQVDRFNMKSPKSLDPVNFENIKRYALKNGLYDIEVLLKDGNRKDNEALYRSNIIIDYDALNLRQSDIQLLSSYKVDSLNQISGSKNGYFMEALPFSFYDKDLVNLIFYNEIYNSDSNIGDDFLMSYKIIKAFGAGANEKPALISNKRLKSAPFIANLLKLDIAQLESGNYRFIVSIRNRNNDLLSEKETFFQRSNPDFNRLDTLSKDAVQTEFVAALMEKDLNYAMSSIMMNLPDADVSIVNDMFKNKDLAAQRLYLFKYWAKRNGTLPEQAYDEYMMVAKAIDKTYSNGFGYGFNTDRGRIYMKYGRPSDVTTVENESGAVPYEVWVYNEIASGKQTNVRFLFYNPSLVLNGYKLLHSTCRGEIQNPRWKYDLYKNVPNEQTGSYIDGTNGVKDNFNRRAEQIFNSN